MRCVRSPGAMGDRVHRPHLTLSIAADGHVSVVDTVASTRCRWMATL
jgi:hypothetical protein